MLQGEGVGVSHAIFDSVLVPKRTAKRRFRQAILEAWGHACAYCGEAGANTLDHVLPRHRGGLTVRANLVAACQRCNLSKSSESWREWFSRQDHHCLNRERRIEEWVAAAEWARIKLG